MRISASGIKRAAAANATAVISPAASPIPSTFSMVLVSFFPQYWAVRTVAPEVMPMKISVMIN